MNGRKRFEYATCGRVFKNVRVLVDGVKLNNPVGKSLRRAIIQRLSPLALLDFWNLPKKNMPFSFLWFSISPSISINTSHKTSLLQVTSSSEPCMDGESLSVICIQDSYLVNINLFSVKGRLMTGETSLGVKGMEAAKVTTRCLFLDIMIADFLWAPTSWYTNLP